MQSHHHVIPPSVVQSIAEQTSLLQARSIEPDAIKIGEVIQELWSGYGAIVRVHARNSTFNTAILKLIQPPDNSAHPRGWDTDVSHQRKLKSYQVETNWYRQYAADCQQDCKVPAVIASSHGAGAQWILMEDLSTDYPLRGGGLTVEQAAVCLCWLAKFHARFLGCSPSGLWPIGTYWHLDTRPDELAAMPESQLKRAAHVLDNRLNNCEYQTIVHGDAKVANFCFSSDMSAVAAVDFQYVGGGVGIKDVAYFLGSCLDESTIDAHEDQLLDWYFDSLEEAIASVHSKAIAQSVRAAWSDLYCVAWTDFYRFLEGWMPGHKKINRYTKQVASRAFSQLDIG